MYSIQTIPAPFCEPLHEQPIPATPPIASPCSPKEPPVGSASVAIDATLLLVLFVLLQHCPSPQHRK